MNKKKKMNIKRPDFSETLIIFKKKCIPLIENVSPYWLRLPVFHRKALRILVPVTFVLFLLPSGAKEEADSIRSIVTPTAEMQRQSVSLNLEGLSEQDTELRDALSFYEVEQEKREVKSVEKTVDTSISPPEQSVEKWHDYKIQKGDTLYQIFRKNNLSLTELNRVVKIEGADKPLSNVKKGQLFRFKLNTNGELDILQIERQGEAIMFFRMSDGNFGRSK